MPQSGFCTEVRVVGYPDSQWAWHLHSVVWIYDESDGCPTNGTPESTAACKCNAGYAVNGALASQCVPVVPPDAPARRPQACSANPGVGDPIYPVTGTERYTTALNFNVGREPLTATYDTIWRAPAAVPGTELEFMGQSSFGSLWETSVHKKIVIAASNLGALAHRGSGRHVRFTSPGNGVFTPEAPSTDKLLSVSGGYRYIDVENSAEETYDVNGLVTRIDRADGSSLIYTYSTTSTPTDQAPGPGYVMSIADQFGHATQFRYDGRSGRINRITGASGQRADFAQDGAGNLKQIYWADSTSRLFMYENTLFPWALTGIVDENNQRHATISYDAQGRAIASELAGGVDRHSVSYTQAPALTTSDAYDSVKNVVTRTRGWQAPQSPVVTLPVTGTLNLGISTVGGVPGVTSRSQPAGSGCAASTSNQSFDANGNLSQKDDFNGKRVCYANDLTRNLQTTRVEGLANTASCGTLVATGATLPAGSRKVNTQWHPHWHLPTKIAEPGRLTTRVYNGQPDPFNGNAMAACAPSTALLPDGKPIAVLCKSVEQATTDANGAAGFSATLQSGVANKTTTWTYNQFGQVLSEDGPRTDVSDLTAYTYYTDTTVDHTVGDLKTLTNAAGQVTNFTKYNAAGQLLQSTDPNGVVTTNGYDVFGRLQTAKVDTQTTGYDYDPRGMLRSITWPDGQWLTYEYDDAHRQTAVRDNLGNRIDYTLDNAGNRIGETTKNNAAAIRRQLSRSIDALNRVQQTTGRE